MYRVIERERRIRVDTAAKILGKTQFTIDVSLPGTLTAIVSIHPASAVIEPGQIVERGCHSVLLAAGGRYADLYQRQFRGSPDRLSAA